MGKVVSTMLATDAPYNPANRLMQMGDLERLLHKYAPGIKIGNINLYRTAMVHKSYCTRKNENFIQGNVSRPAECLPLQEESNERLEFLGDAVLSLVVGNYLYERYPDESEGFLTRVRTKLVNGNMLAELCQYAGIPPFCIVSHQIEEGNGRQNKKILEDTFEAFLGALFLDAQHQGANAFDAASEWIMTLIETNLDFIELLKQNNNYKDTFLKYYQHNFNYIPKFVDVSPGGLHQSDSNCRSFKIMIKDQHGTVLGLGTGQTKKLAENQAAHRALKYLGQIPAADLAPDAVEHDGSSL